MREIPLTQGKYALVDDEDYGRLKGYKWFARKDKNAFYASRKSPRVNGRQTMIQMHHEVIGQPQKGFETDHRDNNGLNNQRSNLRHVTRRQNQQNRKYGSSKYPGVSWIKTRRKWLAQITINGINKNLGGFKTELLAFNAYRQAVEQLGEQVVEII